MTSPGELLLKQKYKKMLGLESVDNTSDIDKRLFISQITNLQQSLDNKLNNNNSILQNNLTINNTLFVSSNTILQGTTSILSDLNVSGISNLNNIRALNIISNNDNYNNNNDVNSTINMYSNYINIGTTTSIVNIQGTTSYINTNETKYYDKLIHVNVSSTSSAMDNGILSGITIKGNNGDGYIKTNTTATNFLIKPPLISTDAYIATTDLNNNFIVSGTTQLLNSVTINSNLLVNNDTTILTNLYVSNNSILNTILSNNNLNISSNTIINGNITNNGNIFISGNITNNSSLYVSGNTIINNNLYISGNTLFNNNISCLTNIYISGYSILQGTTSLLSILNISGNTNISSNLLVNNTSILNKNVSILSSLYISGNTIINGTTNLNSNLTISGNSLFNGHTSFITSVSILGPADLYTLSVSKITVTSNSILNGISNLSNLKVSGNTVLINNVTLLSDIKISGTTIINNTLINNGTILSNLNILGDSVFNNVNISGNSILNNTTILSNLNISGNSIFNDTTILSNLYISGISQFDNIIRGRNINSISDDITDITNIDQTLNILGHVINIGSSNSYINILGSTNIVNDINLNNALNLKLNASEILNYYNKLHIDTSLSDINTNIGLKLNASEILNYYNKTQVDTQFSNLINSAPEALNTLKELSDALNNDANYASTVQNQIATKRNISDSYNKLEVDNIFNTNKHTINTANINFMDVNNLNINTLTIKGGQYIKLIDYLSNSLIDLDNSQISITPPLKLLSNLIVNGTASISNIYTKTEVNNLINVNTNSYTKTESDTLLNNKQSILNSSSLITVDTITATSYSTPNNHTFVDITGTTRLTLGTTTNTFLNRVVAPTFNATGSVLTASTSEGVEIGRNETIAIVRIAGQFPTLRLETVGTSGTAFGFSIQRNSSTNLTTAMVGTTSYQVWANGANSFNQRVECTNNLSTSGNFSVSGTSTLKGAITGASTLTVSGNSILNNLTVNGTFSNPSDEILKTNINNLSQDDVIYALKHLDPKIYDRTDIIKYNEIGFIAQEVQTAIPLNWSNVISSSDSGLLQIDYTKLGSPILWAICKNLLARIEILEAKINSN